MQTWGHVDIVLEEAWRTTEEGRQLEEIAKLEDAESASGHVCIDAFIMELQLQDEVEAQAERWYDIVEGKVLFVCLFVCGG